MIEILELGQLEEIKPSLSSDLDWTTTVSELKLRWQHKSYNVELKGQIFTTGSILTIVIIFPLPIYPTDFIMEMIANEYVMRFCTHNGDKYIIWFQRHTTFEIAQNFGK